MSILYDLNYIKHYKSTLLFVNRNIKYKHVFLEIFPLTII